MYKKNLQQLINISRQSPEYKNYLEVREFVFDMMNKQNENNPSKYWEEELEGFNYMFDASPLIIQKLREHCYHLTGIKSYEYRQHHSRQKKIFAEKLQLLKENDKNNLFIPESSQLGGFGHNIDGSLVNIDTLKFYESLIALDKSGILEELKKNPEEKKITVEIGSGWGGFAYQLKKCLPNISLVLIDLPQTLIFSGVYLKTLFPKSKFMFYGDHSDEEFIKNIDKNDFTFIPHSYFNKLQINKIDLAINMVSFQEMTTNQVDNYMKWLAQNKCKKIYSHNRDRSPNNPELTEVSNIIKKYYHIHEQHVLDYQYNDFSIITGIKRYISMKYYRIIVVKFLNKIIPKKKLLLYSYRHLVGKLK